MSMQTVATAQDARHAPLSTADKLEQDARQAARVRALSNHPDVVALRVERVRTQIDVMIWAGIFLGLAFTMVNVQGFAAAGAVVGTLSWCAAWLLDPMVSIVLVAVLRAEQITARYQVDTGRWGRRTKWFAFAATYAMNTWRSWAGLDVAGIVLHSVPPALVFLAAETAPVLRDRLTEAVMRAADMATGTTRPAPDVLHRTAPAEAVNEATTEATPKDTTTPVTAPVVRRAPRKAPVRKQPNRPAGRKLLADYVAEARAAYTPGTEISPAWVRSVTDCARGTSKAVADALRDEVTTTPALDVSPVLENAGEAA
jgi:hypothetical protein